MRSIELPHFVHAWINWNHHARLVKSKIIHQEISSFVAVIPARSRSRTVISSLFRNYPTFCCHKSQHVTTVWKKSPLIRQTMANSQATSMAVSENQVAPIHPTPMVFLLRINCHFRTKPGCIMNYSHSLSWRKNVIIQTATCKWFPSNFPWFQWRTATWNQNSQIHHQIHQPSNLPWYPIKFMIMMLWNIIWLKTGWWFQHLWNIWTSIGRIISYIMENKKCLKPPTRIW